MNFYLQRKSSIKLAESPLVAPLIFSPQGYRRLRSTLEVVCGLVLAFVPGALKHYANIVLLALCLTHIILVWAATATMPDPDDRDAKSKEDARPKSRASQLGLQACSTELVFSLLLACRLLMVAQNARHVASLAEDKKAAPSANAAEPDAATADNLQHELDDLPDLQKAQEDPAEMARCLKKIGELKRRLEAQTQAKAAASS